MCKGRGDNLPIVIRTYQVPHESNYDTVENKCPSTVSKQICDEMEDLSLAQPPLFPNMSCVFEKAEMWKDGKDSEDSMNAQKKDPDYTLHIPSYLFTPTKRKYVPSFTPSPERKRSMKEVSWSDKVEYIDDDSTVKTSNKKARTHVQSSPSHKTGPSAKDKAWKYDDNDLSYCSHSSQDDKIRP